MGQINSPQYQLRESDRRRLDKATSSDQVEVLFEQLAVANREGRSEESAWLRDRLVILHGGLVEHCARNLMTTSEPLEDLVQEGYVGLMKAVDRYDPNQGVRFCTYACHLINGEIRHYLRDLGRLIHEPGWHFELRARIIKAQEDLVQRLGREPSAPELASAIGEDPKTVREVLKTQQILAVEFPDQANQYDDDETSVWDKKFLGKNDGGQSLVDNQLMLTKIFPHLREMEKEALIMHFFQDCSKTEVARHLGISVNHAAYILKRGLETLRCMIEISEEIWQPPSPQARARATFILEKMQQASGIERVDAANEEIEYDISPSALIPGMMSFVDLVELLDDRLNADEEEESEFSLLWLWVQGWEQAVASFDPALRREAINAVQMLTRKCCRSTDYTSLLMSPTWSGLHFVMYLPNTGSNAGRVGRRWKDRCKMAEYWPDTSAAVQNMHIQLRVECTFKVFPRDGATLEELFTKLGQSISRKEAIMNSEV